MLAHGNPTVAQLVRRRLAVGDEMGRVPDDAPTVPLARDLAAVQKRLRMKVSPVEETLDLDLRKPNDLARSHLLHRLRLLGIGWGHQTARTGRSLGTFHEVWALAWEPELAISVVEAGLHGTTVEGAAAAAALDRARSSSLPEMTALVEDVLLADLPAAVDGVLDALQERAAVATDVGLLMDAVGPLVRVARYGDVRGTDAEAVRRVIDGVLVRVCSGLAGLAASTDDAAAEALTARIDAVHGAVGLLDDPDHRDDWSAALARLVTPEHVHGLVAGRATRLLSDGGRLESDHVGRLLSQALSIGAAPERSARWLEGFLRGGALVLLHDRSLLTLLDDWIATVDGRIFDDLLPLLRRAFSQVPRTDRRLLGDAVAAGPASGTARERRVEVDLRRAMPAVERLLALAGIGGERA